MTPEELDAYLTDSYGLRNTLISTLIAHDGLDKSSIVIEDRGYNELLLKKIKEFVAIYSKYILTFDATFYTINYPGPHPIKKEVA